MSEVDPRWSELLEAARQVVEVAESGDVGGVIILGRGSRLSSAIRAFDPPKPKRHVFGGVRFEEVGVSDFPRKGEWFLSTGGRSAHLAEVDLREVPRRMILRPVGLEAGDE